MAIISKSPRTFEKTCDMIHVVVCAGCLLAFTLSWVGPFAPMGGFPVLFFLGAGLNLLTCFLRFRRENHHDNRRFQRIQGLFCLIVALLLLVMSYVSAVCIWWK